MRRELLQPVTLDVRDNLLEVLVGNHQRFLTFLERRVASRGTAEDILQDGFVRALERADSVHTQESAVAWFYRLLRNALVDYYRRRKTEDHALVALATDQPEAEDDAELRETICACVGELVETLKPEYRDALRRVELEGERVDAFAREAGITATNASVRLHRARQALRLRLLETCGTCVTHGCRDDIAVAPDGTAYTSDTFGGRVLRLRRGATALDVWVTDSSLTGIDGLSFLADGALYVNTYFTGKLLRIPVKPDGSPGPIVPLATSIPLGHPDGLRPAGPKTLVQAEGQGRLTEITIDGDRAAVRVVRDGLTNASGVTLVGNAALVVVDHLKAIAVPYAR